MKPRGNHYCEGYEVHHCCELLCEVRNSIELLISTSHQASRVDQSPSDLGGQDYRRR